MGGINGNSGSGCYYPKGDELHERLVEYGKAYMLYNLGYPEDYIQTDSDVYDDTGHMIVDIASIPHRKVVIGATSHKTKHVCFECGSLSGDLEERLKRLINVFDMVLWLPYPYMTDHDHYGGDLWDKVKNRNTIGDFYKGTCDIIIPWDVAEKNKNKKLTTVKYYQETGTKKYIEYWLLNYDQRFYGHSTTEGNMVYYYQVRPLVFFKDLDKTHDIGLYPFGTQSLRAAMTTEETTKTEKKITQAFLTAYA